MRLYFRELKKAGFSIDVQKDFIEIFQDKGEPLSEEAREGLRIFAEELELTAEEHDEILVLGFEGPLWRRLKTFNRAKA